MRFDISPTYNFYFRLTPDEIGLIGRVADIHYDWVCKAANQNNGIVRSWAKWSELDPEIKCEATFRELDLVCKILEPGNYSGAQFSQDEKNQCFAFFTKFMKALEETNKLYKVTEIDL